MKLGFLHTAQVHVATFDALLRDQPVILEHKVKPEFLSAAINQGFTAGLADDVRLALAELQQTGCRLVVCTCSTLGQMVEEMEVEGLLTQRVDRAAADLAVMFPRLLVLTALEEAASAAVTVLEQSAQRHNRAANWQLVTIPNIWSLFEAGQMSEYIDAIVEVIDRQGADYDAVFLAQASMAAAARRANHVHVLTSPAIGVQHALATARLAELNVQ